MSERTNPIDNAMPQESSAALTVSEARQIYVQKNYDAYAPYFERFDKNQRRFMVTWSWWGFFATSGWLLYRKMNLPFLAYFVLLCLVPQLTFALISKLVISIGGYSISTMGSRELADLYDIVNICNIAALVFLFGIIIGLLGHWLYYRQVNSAISKAREKSGNNRAAMADMLARQGKLNNPIIVAVGVYLIMPIGYSIIIGQIGQLFM